MESAIAYPAWEQSRRKHLGYARRVPEQTVLYRVIYHHRQALEYLWEDQFQQRFGALRHAVLTAFDAYLNCGILAHGCARAYCQNCKHSELIAFSCKRRGLCPSCDAKRGLIFAEQLNQTVLPPLPQRHLVFSLPKRMRVYFKYNRSLCKHLYRGAWDAYSSFVKQAFPDLPEAKTGAVMALHTAGDLLNFHPHIHTIALDGVIDSTGTFHRLTECDIAHVQATFEQYIFDALLDEELISQDVVNSMQSWEHSGFNVFSATPIEADDEQARMFVARYLKKSPLALDRLSINESAEKPTIVCTRKCDDGEDSRFFSPLEFLAEISQHIPDTWEQTTRYFGCYAARSRKLLNSAKKALPEILTQAADPPPDLQSAKPASQHWARWIKKVYEVDPLICKKCGADMKIIAFVHKASEIEKISDNLGLQPYRAPPPIRKHRAGKHCEPDFDHLQFADID